MSRPKPTPDPEGIKWWDNHFSNNDKAPMALFLTKLKSLAPSETEELLEKIATVIIPTLSADIKDEAKNARSNIYKTEWSHFLLLFGPFDQCVAKCRLSLFDSNGKLHLWYHGCETKEGAQKKLNGEEMGSYVVRTSGRVRNAFVVQYSKMVKGAPNQKNRLAFNSPNGYAYKGANSGYKTLHALVQGDPDLVYALVSPLVGYGPLHENKGSSVYSAVDSSNNNYASINPNASSGSGGDSMYTSVGVNNTGGSGGDGDSMYSSVVNSSNNYSNVSVPSSDNGGDSMYSSVVTGGNDNPYTSDLASSAVNDEDNMYSAVVKPN